MCTTTMVAAVRTNLNPKTPSYGGGGERARPQNPTRPPLIPSEPDNALAPPRRSKYRDVTSRYAFSSSSSSYSSSSALSAYSDSRRYPSPLVSRTAASNKVTSTPASSPAVRLAQSAERRRAATPVKNAPDLKNRTGSGCSSAVCGVSGGGDISSAQKMLFTSTRSLSVSFQGESFSFQVSKAKPAPASAASPLNLRRNTPERRKATATPSDNSKLIEQHRWPGRMNQQQPSCVTRSLSFGDERTTGIGGSVGNVVMRVLNSSYGNIGENIADVTSPVIGSESASDDSESISSSSTNSASNDAYGDISRRYPRGFTVPVRFREDANSPALRTPVAAVARDFATASKLFVPPLNKFPIDSSVSSPRLLVSNRGLASPVRGPYRHGSPSKAVISAVSTPSRGISPSRVTIPSCNNSRNSPSILSFTGDVRRAKVAEYRILDAHVLRILHNRLLQWRFVNARADVALSVQKLNAERSLYNAWVSTEELRESVKVKRTELQFMRQRLKLISILKGQMMYLEEWSHVDQAYTGALSGAIESLRASTLRLPVIGGARADIQNVKDAISSAVDLFQTMLSTISLSSPKVEETNSLVGELSNLTAKERALLRQCKILLSTVAALLVKECSIQTQIVQLTSKQT